MSEILTLVKAERMAERLAAAIESADPDPVGRPHPNPVWQKQYAVDRERVASDLAGLKACHVMSLVIEECELIEMEEHHARRYSDGLRRTARLYGVEEES